MAALKRVPGGSAGDAAYACPDRSGRSRGEEGMVGIRSVTAFEPVPTPIQSAAVFRDARSSLPRDCVTLRSARCWERRRSQSEGSLSAGERETEEKENLFFLKVFLFSSSLCSACLRVVCVCV